MSNKKYEFHIDHNVKPSHIEPIISLLNSKKYTNKKALYKTLENSGHYIHLRHFNKNILIYGKLEIIENNDDSIKLTDLGHCLKYYLNFNKSVFYDLIHFLYFTTWDFTKEDNILFSWSYKTICELLWERKSNKFNRKRLSSELLSLAQEEFNDREISISHEAITGCLNWISELDPFFIIDVRKNQIGNGRDSCSPELFLLAIYYLYQILGINIQSPILIDDYKKVKIAKLCLLNKNAFNGMLNITKETFDSLKLEFGEWGSYLILQKKIKIKDLCKMR
jgi:hypothetical protein